MIFFWVSLAAIMALPLYVAAKLIHDHMRCKQCGDKNILHVHGVCKLCVRNYRYGDKSDKNNPCRG